MKAGVKGSRVGCGVKLRQALASAHYHGLRNQGVVMPATALSGTFVLDLARGPAALAGRILADLGAQVVLIEPPGGNPLRRDSSPGAGKNGTDW